MKWFRHKHNSKAFSLTTLTVLLISIIQPAQLWALTSGPGQPELEGFAPVQLNQMVDPFTGDFNYNIPLMNVPGPDGGYPINISYGAGASMEQEASWVGLGWSLNPGVVNRQVRGLPDDFNGQKVTKQLHNKPNRTLTFNLASKDIEALGMDLSKVLESSGLEVGGNLNLSYNNYTGFKVRPGFSFSVEEIEKNAPKNNAENKEDTASSGSGQEEEKTNIIESYADYIAKLKNKIKKNNLSNDNIKWPGYTGNFRNKPLTMIGANAANAAGSSLGFASLPITQNIPFDHPRSNRAFSFNMKTGLTVVGVTKDLQVDVHYSQQTIQKNVLKLPAFGYMHNDNAVFAGGRVTGLKDFTRDNQSTLNRNSRILPIPVMTPDIFKVSGQGIGGTFRSYRSRVGLVSDPTSVSNSSDIGGGLEFNGGFAEIKGGGNFRSSNTISYSGPWIGNYKALQFLEAPEGWYQTQVPLSEPYFFKFSNELTAQTNKGTIHTDESIGRFKLTTAKGLFRQVPKLTNRLKGSSTSWLSHKNFLRTQREGRAKGVIALNKNEAEAYHSFSRTAESITDGSPVDLDLIPQESPYNSAISELMVTNEQGLKYIYGIPAYNREIKANIFSIDERSTSTASPLPKVVSYTATDNSYKNTHGLSNTFRSTVTPKHAHSFLLTEVLSPDYADLTNNGVTPDDNGSYTKFNYVVDQNYISKTPITGAHYIAGNMSDANDNLATTTIIKKDLYYLKTIKTKTHVAVFYLKDREDAYTVSNENDLTPTEKRRKLLEKITLYELEDYESSSLNNPIKTVNFEYDYALCSGVPNNSGTVPGKLTLKKIYYTVGSERTKESLSPYEFQYGFNPIYEGKNVDRWGSFSDESDNPYGSNVIYPYSIQDSAIANTNAEAWNLTQIKLPTGGLIKVKYEADRYQYVQDKKAQQMYELKGFKLGGGHTPDLIEPFPGHKLYAVIEIPGDPLATDAALKHVKNIKDMYFKAFVKMKNNPQGTVTGEPFNKNGVAYDFVEGYMKVLPGASVSLFNSNHIWVPVKLSGGDNPIKKAGWVDMKMNRNDLKTESLIPMPNIQGFSGSTIKNVLNILSAALQVSEGDPFFTKADRKGYCERLGNFPGAPPSIVRLNHSGNYKIGGGHRVREITINDNWTHSGESQSNNYGQQYFYTLKDGSSSGVAQYEPQTGNEENPFRRPIRYSSDRNFIKDDYHYTELPMGESLFPSPIVGYSRVTVKNIANENYQKSGAGIVVKEFYTAKDYPVITKNTEVQTVNTSNVNQIKKFVGVKKGFQPGFSQGFKIELNDMHGKPKSEATYSANPQVAKTGPVSKTEYFYKTQGGDYSPGQPNKLENKVSVFYGNGITRKEKIGVIQDNYLDLKESRTKSTSFAIDANLHTMMFFFIPIIIPVPAPKFDNAYNLTRTAVNTKVIEKTGILEKVVNTERNAKTEVKNLAFDFDTGEPVLVSRTNEFGDKVFTYNKMAKWFYADMQGVYQNLGLVIYDEGDRATIKELKVGDVLVKGDKKVWITEIKPEDSTPEDRLTGKYYDESSDTWVVVNDLTGYRVIEPHNENQLKASAGQLTLKNDIREADFSVVLLNEIANAYPAQSYQSSGSVAYKHSCDPPPNPIVDPDGNIIDCSDYLYTLSGSQLMDPDNYPSPQSHLDLDIIKSYDHKGIKEFERDQSKSFTVNFNDCNFPGGKSLEINTDMDPIWQLMTQDFYQASNTSVHRVVENYEPKSVIYKVQIVNNGSDPVIICDHHDIYLMQFELPYDDLLQNMQLAYLGGRNLQAYNPVNGQIYPGKFLLVDGNDPSDFGTCFKPCPNLDILNATTQTYTTDLKYTENSTEAGNFSNNRAPYHWNLHKPFKNLVHIKSREPIATSAPAYATDIREDGLYEDFTMYDYFAPDNATWTVATTIKKYSRHGTPMEEMDALGNYSAALYAENGLNVTAVAQNSAYLEMAYESFEDHGSSYQTDHYTSHLIFPAELSLSTAGIAHTGRYSGKLMSAQSEAVLSTSPASSAPSLTSGKQYIIQAWHKAGSGGTLKAFSNGTAVAATTVSPVIEGWELMEVVFEAATDSKLILEGQGAYFDDIRLMPVNASMNSYVYDPITYQLSAELDANNFATFYNYDRDQVLVQVKKETERGIKTLQNTIQVNNQQASLQP